MANQPGLLSTFLALPLKVWGPGKPLRPRKLDRVVTAAPLGGLQIHSFQFRTVSHPGVPHVRPFPDRHMPQQSPLKCWYPDHGPAGCGLAGPGRRWRTQSWRESAQAGGRVIQISLNKHVASTDP